MTNEAHTSQSTDQPPALKRIREIASTFFVIELWVFVPVIALVAWLAGNSVSFVLIAGGVTALAGTAMWLRDKTVPATRFSLGSALVAQWMFLVYAASGTPDGLVLDAHMVYFVISAQMLAFFCWRSIGIVTIIPAIHHLFFSLLYPLLIWPSMDYTFIHLGNHVIFVVLISATCLWLSWRVEELFIESYKSLAGMEAAQQEADRLAQRQAELEQQSQAERTELLHKLSETFESSIKQFVGGLAASTAQSQEAAKGLAQLTGTSSDLSASASQAADAASRNVQAVTAAAEGLDTAIQEMSRGVQHQAAIAAEASAMAGRSDEEVRMLSDRAQKIGDVVDLINSIASQTNLLALNATIEAARAGEAGKGFAVVASEVKNLANQTAKATEDIAAQVMAMQDRTVSTVKAIQEIGAKIQAMTEISSTVASSVEEQSGAATEICRSAREAAVGVQDVAQAVSGTSDAARSASSRTSDLVDSSNDAVRKAGELRGIAEAFVNEIRAA